MIKMMLGLLAAFSLVTSATAHRQPEVFTEVLYLEQDGEWVSQVTHRLHAEDALRALRTIQGATDDLGTEANLARLALYVASRFEVKGEPLETIGAEIDGNYVYVFQEGPRRIEVKNASILANVDRAWSNSINIEEEDGVETVSLYFSETGEQVTDHHHH